MITGSQCSVTFTMVLIVTGMFFNGALSSGHFSSPTDLAPNLAGTIFGMSNTLSGGLTAYLTAITVGAITQDNYTFQAWTIVFSSAAAIYVVTSLFYFFMISGDIQQWNDFVSGNKSRYRNNLSFPGAGAGDGAGGA